MENCRMYGLELNPLIEFDNYERGVKITKRLNIKNITKNIIRFRFLFQSSPYFTYPLQELESISPGLNKSYYITFLNSLNDFQTINETLNILIQDIEEDKNISIKLTATPLKCDIIFPSVLNFKDMVIKQKSREELIIKNQGSLNAIIKLSHKCASKEKKGKIKLEPSQFVLRANQKQHIQIIIYTDVPQKFREFLTCSIIEVPKSVEKKLFSQESPTMMNTTLHPYEENYHKEVNDIIQVMNQEDIQICLIKEKIELNWVSVLPQIIILSEESKQIFNKSVINFGPVTLGQRINKTIHLQNLTYAPIKVKVDMISASMYVCMLLCILMCMQMNIHAFELYAYSFPALHLYVPLLLHRDQRLRSTKKNNVFQLLKEKFTINGCSKEEIILHINGQNPVNEYTEIIQFKACKDYCIELFLICEIKSIKLHFSKILYLFENLKLGDNVTEKITIRNDENTDVHVEIVNIGNVFNIKNNKFIIKKKSYHSVNLTCHCIYPINVYKRLYFLVHLNKQIFYVDAICNYSISYQMCPLSMHHIFRYKHLIRDKQKLYNSYYDQKDYIDIWDFPLEFDAYEDSSYEMINEIMEVEDGDVFVVPRELEVLESEEKDIMIINKTPIEYTCVWSNAVDPRKKQFTHFEVKPEEAQLLPYGCQTFRVKNVKTLKERYIKETHECIIFPSNNKDYRKCNSKTLLPPIFLYVTLFQFKIKYLCETENVPDRLSFYPKHISFLNMIERESPYVVAKFENNSDVAQMVDFTPFKGDMEAIRVYPLVNYVPKRSFLNVLIFYSHKKIELNESEIKIYYLVNGIKKKHISVFVSREINSVLLNNGDPNINLQCVSTDTDSSKKVVIENMTERNALCMLIKEDVSKIVDINIEGNKSMFEEQNKEDKVDDNMDEINKINVDQFQNGSEKKNKETSLLINEDKKYNFYFFSLFPFEKRNLHISAFSDSTLSKSIPLLFDHMLYINQEDMKNKFIYLKNNMKDHLKNCRRFLIHVNIVKCSLTLHPKIIESEPIISGTTFNAKIRIHNEHPVKVNFKTKTEISQIDNRNIFAQEEIKEADKNIIAKESEDVINPFSEKYSYVSFNTNQQGRFVYRFCAFMGGKKMKERKPTMSYVDIILNVVMPYFQIIDINDFKTPQSIYWNMTSVDKINMYLKENISEIDMEYKKSQGMENMKKLFNQFNYIPFNIGNNTLNEITQVNLVLYNPLNVPLKVQINSIKSYILPILPPYVKNEEEQLAHLLYVDNTFRSFMRCLDCCEIRPTNFEIIEKGTKTITLYYKHKYIGLHNMPLIIDVENGKVVPLSLCSLTFHPQVPPIYLMNIKDLNEHVLGLKNECIINIDILNDSELDIYYDIEQNKNLVVLNPKGVIKRRKYISLFILISRLSPSIIIETLIMKPYFKHLHKDIELNRVPIELKLKTTADNIYKDAYKKINVFNNKCINDIHGQSIKTFCSNFVPPYSYIHVKNKLFYITPSSINILYAPTNSIVERVVIIKNYSLSKNLKFKISSKNTLPGNLLKITPNKGIVKKEEHIVLRFTFILSDILLDIEGNIQIELKYVENDVSLKVEPQENSCIVDDPSETKIEEVYEDTRDERRGNEGAKVLQISKMKKKKKFDDITFSYAQKIFENIQMFKYSYENINNSMLQKAVRRLYGIHNEEPSKEENPKESVERGVSVFPKFYFYIHIKLFTCNSDDIATAKNNFKNLVRTNIYPEKLYFKKYINLPIPLEDKSKRFFKRHYFEFDKMEKIKTQDEKGNRICFNEEFKYHKRDIYVCMFTGMFKSIIKNDIKKHIAILSDINSCSIQTIENILREDLIDVVTRNKKTDLNSQIKYDYTFLRPAILSHFFSHMFSDIINNLINETSLFAKKLD
ncbi:hypothetical protein, conserved [Plasmodium gonderi]|uniref:CFAP65-like ninth Ig-like domain-containing protein n=1 Tax=Plasmodium gonderi TaxID=77519 RepID=A0A1Y1JLR0_PLAGO|nr:hypothetical protein, conserved [Plasmodium gonderi]GAW80994.1 hypothetical protein, conserved [Plasmodium gonderi]